MHNTLFYKKGVYLALLSICGGGLKVGQTPV